ncbi:MAG: hypothetical protein JXB17_04645 [Bacteroidales bacterium]|nr:hypothetical protein [Bacteroidales bacterium]
MKTLIFTLTTTIFIISCLNQPVKQEKYSLVKVWSTDTLLRTPESAYYDQERDVIFVSNINSGATEEGDNGFISKLNRQGEIIELKWVTGINTPKGIGVFGNNLYVTETNKLVIIDIEKAEIIEKISIEGTGFLNDISIDSLGKVFISDSKANKIFTFYDGKIDTFLNKGIDKTNGLLCESERLLLASSDFNAIDYKTKEITIINDSIQGGDGIAAIGDGFYFVSEWPGEVFLIKPDHSIISILNTRAEKRNTADIDYIKKDSILLVPTFYENTIDAYKFVVK